jgi:hypothetical protein
MLSTAAPENQLPCFAARVARIRSGRAASYMLPKENRQPFAVAEGGLLLLPVGLLEAVSRRITPKDNSCNPSHRQLPKCHWSHPRRPLPVMHELLER